MASLTVLAVSYASSGDTSNDTQPSTPPVASWIGRKRSAAWVRSSSASSKNNASPDLPSCPLLADGIVVEVGILDGVVEDRGVRSEPRHRKIVDVAAERPARQEPAGDVVEPEALAEIVQLLRWLHNFRPPCSPALRL